MTTKRRKSQSPRRAPRKAVALPRGILKPDDFDVPVIAVPHDEPIIQVHVPTTIIPAIRDKKTVTSLLQKIGAAMKNLVSE